MRNIILAVSLTVNIFIGTSLYGFMSGKIASKAAEPVDYATEMHELEKFKPVKIAHR